MKSNTVTKYESITMYLLLLLLWRLVDRLIIFNTGTGARTLELIFKRLQRQRDDQEWVWFHDSIQCQERINPSTYFMNHQWTQFTYPSTPYGILPNCRGWTTRKILFFLWAVECRRRGPPCAEEVEWRHCPPFSKLKNETASWPRRSSSSWIQSLILTFFNWSCIMYVCARRPTQSSPDIYILLVEWIAKKPLCYFELLKLSLWCFLLAKTHRILCFLKLTTPQCIIFIDWLQIYIHTLTRVR